MSRYEGELKLKWIPDGRLMELLDDFAFVDRKEKRWHVPSGTRVDGASIPQFLWSIIGSPYVGKYRDASVVHDFYCSVRTEPCDETHNMFFEAMIVSGVSRRRALIMYAAVRYAGPRWSDMDVHNTRLNEGRNPRYLSKQDNYWGPGGMPPFDTPEYLEWQQQQDRERERARQPKVLKDANAQEFNDIVNMIRDGRLNRAAIDKLTENFPASRFEEFPQYVHPFPNEDPMLHSPKWTRG